MTRTGDQFIMDLFPHSDSGGHYGWGGGTDVYSTKLYVGGQLLNETDSFPFGTFPASAAPGTYRLVLNGKRATARRDARARSATAGSTTRTTWPARRR